MPCLVCTLGEKMSLFLTARDFTQKSRFPGFLEKWEVEGYRLLVLLLEYLLEWRGCPSEWGARVPACLLPNFCDSPGPCRHLSLSPWHPRWCLIFSYIFEFSALNLVSTHKWINWRNSHLTAPHTDTVLATPVHRPRRWISTVPTSYDPQKAAESSPPPSLALKITPSPLSFSAMFHIPVKPAASTAFSEPASCFPILEPPPSLYTPSSWKPTHLSGATSPVMLF